MLKTQNKFGKFLTELSQHILETKFRVGTRTLSFGCNVLDERQNDGMVIVIVGASAVVCGLQDQKATYVQIGLSPPCSA